MVWKGNTLLLTRADATLQSMAQHTCHYSFFMTYGVTSRNLPLLRSLLCVAAMSGSNEGALNVVEILSLLVHRDQEELDILKPH